VKQRLTGRTLHEHGTPLVVKALSKHGAHERKAIIII